MKEQVETRPFLLFGPPGTGKTRCIVTAILEIVLTTNKYVLVCCNSNSACDEITERLAKSLKKNEIFGLYAKSYGCKNITSKITPICNLNKGKIQFPSLSYLYQFRVLICTLLTAGSITRAREVDQNFDSGHFSYIFIDEAASCHEPIALILIAGMIFHYFYSMIIMIFIGI